MNTDSPGAWLIILLLCAFTLVMNLTLVSLWRHRHHPPQHGSSRVIFRLPQGGLRHNEEAEWEQLAQVVHTLPLAESTSSSHQHEDNTHP